MQELRQWTFEDTPKIRCHLECMFKKMGVYTNEDGYDVDRTIDGFKRVHPTVDVSEAKETLTKCVNEGGNAVGECMNSFTTFKCFFEKYGTEMKDVFAQRGRKHMKDAVVTTSGEAETSKPDGTSD